MPRPPPPWSLLYRFSNFLNLGTRVLRVPWTQFECFVFLSKMEIKAAVNRCIVIFLIGYFHVCKFIYRRPIVVFIFCSSIVMIVMITRKGKYCTIWTIWMCNRRQWRSDICFFRLCFVFTFRRHTPFIKKFAVMILSYFFKISLTLCFLSNVLANQHKGEFYFISITQEKVPWWPHERINSRRLVLICLQYYQTKNKTKTYIKRVGYR